MFAIYAAKVHKQMGADNNWREWGEKIDRTIFFCLFVLMLYVPVNIFSVVLGCFPVWIEPLLSRG